MNPRQIEIVQASFKQLVPRIDEVGALFYSKLFEMAPEVRPMFKGDLRAQQQKLMAALRYVVEHLHSLSDITTDIAALAERHKNYGVQPAHYEVVGAALIATLHAGLGEQFDDELREAWTTAYGIISTAMQGDTAAPVPAVA